MRLVTPEVMKKLEEAANAAGYTYAEMMQKAGEGVAEICDSKFTASGQRFAVGLIGGGNNGGDTLIALTGLQKKGWQTNAILLKKRQPEDPLLLDYQLSGGQIDNDENVVDPFSGETGAMIVLDGVLGTGFKPPMAEDIEDKLKAAQSIFRTYTWVAVDCPSGVDSTSGEVSPAVPKARLTICLEAVKTGLLTPSAFPYCGEILSVELGISEYSQQHQADLVVDQAMARSWLPKRDDFSHKGSYGKVTVAGGCMNYPGAPVLAAKGAYTVGTGLVQVAVPESIAHSGMSGLLEATWLIIEDGGGIISEMAADTLRAGLKKCECLVLGPGIGREEPTRKFIHSLLFKGEDGEEHGAGFLGVGKTTTKKESARFPAMVVDADALALLSMEKDWSRKLQGGCVLTPHPGEMALLSGLTVDEIQANRLEITREHARRWGQVLVLKGALTIIASPTGQIGVVPIATSALAKGGTGDVLAGMIGGLIAQGLDPWHAALTGAWMHARAGLAAAFQAGSCESVLASDVVRAIPVVYRDLMMQ